MRRGRPRHPDRLTPAEWRVVNAIRHGMTNRGIGRRLGVSLDAVKYHVRNALGKLGLDSRRDLKHWHGAPIDSALHDRRQTMAGPVGMGTIGQISRSVKDLDAAVTWYRDVLGLKHLFSFPPLAFFDCGGTRLFLSSKPEDGAGGGDSVLYFRVEDIEASFKELTERGVTFRGAPHMIYRHPNGVEEWMAFFDDVDGKILALMSEVRK
jgi:DNA-binding CsgD family transcriptional regulator/catechol 2,3-dioxygenase-like lactoylglutathione lyase family enzyme